MIHAMLGSGLQRAIVWAAPLVLGVWLAACAPVQTEHSRLSPPADIASVPQGEVYGSGATRIALVLPLTAEGGIGSAARDLKDAAILGFQSYRSSHAQLIIKDTLGTPEGARNAALAAISEGAKIVLGPLRSSSVKIVGQAMRSQRIPVIAFSSDIGAAAPGVYLMGFAPQNDARFMINHASRQGMRAFAALFPKNAYGLVSEAAFRQAVGANGGRVVAIEQYPLDQIGMQEPAKRIAALKGQFDAVFMPDAGDATPILAQLLAVSGLERTDAKFLGSTQWNDPRILGESNLIGAWFPSPDIARHKQFAMRFETAFGRAPRKTASLAYDATILTLALSINGAENLSDTRLTSPAGANGVDGLFRFQTNGQNERVMTVYEIQATGKTQIVAAARTSF